MKKLLVLTDFTANAVHAATAGIKLCEKLQLDLLLYHTVQYLPVVPDYTYGSYVTETADAIVKESGEKLNTEAETLRCVVAQLPGYHPEIVCASGEGRLSDNIRTLTSQEDIQLLVMGGRSGGAIEHLLTGSEISVVIRKSYVPVLVIPEATDLTVLKKIVFATNFGESDIAALNYLSDLAQQLDFRIEVVHVIKAGDAITGIEGELAFREYLNTLDTQLISYQHLYGYDTGKTLQYHCKEIGGALIAMTHAHHNIISRMFGKSETREALDQQAMPVLIFPPDFNK